MRVVWSERANQDFLKQLSWLEQNRSSSMVLQFMTAITEAAERISKSDTVQYQQVKDKPGPRRYPLDKFHWLYYRIEPDQVVIITLADSRQHPDSLKL